MFDVFKKIAIVLVAALVLLGPSGIVLGIGVLMNSAAACLTGVSLTLGPIPDSLAATTATGQRIALDKTQLTHAATIIAVGGVTPDIGREGVTVALMAALTESSLRVLANPSTYPESGTYPNDGNESDHDSLGLFQMRPEAGWGTVAQLMDPTYQARAFYGGPTGPNYPSPRGLLDIPSWQQMSDGQAAQSVEVSAYPYRYANYQPVAEAIITALVQPAAGGSSSSSGGSLSVPETTRVVFPLPSGTWVVSAPFGQRADPITGHPEFHEGTDYAAPAGTSILSATDGKVLYAGMDGGTGTIKILSTVDGRPISFTYLHMYQDGIEVTIGQIVAAGQQIAQVGSSGHSTGPHLHFETHPGGPGAPAVNSVPWLAAHGAATEDAPSIDACTFS